MAISKVVAAQRGGAMSMPTHRMAAVFSARPAFLPRAFWMERMEPPALLMANTPTQETTTSKNTKHARPSGQSVARLHAEVRREDEIAGAEEHGEQRQADDQRVSVHGHLPSHGRRRGCFRIYCR